MARDEEGGDEGDSAYGWIYVVTLAALCVCVPFAVLAFANDSDSQEHRHNFYLQHTNCYLQKDQSVSYD